MCVCSCLPSQRQSLSDRSGSSVRAYFCPHYDQHPSVPSPDISAGVSEHRCPSFRGGARTREHTPPGRRMDYLRLCRRYVLSYPGQPHVIAKHSSAQAPWEERLLRAKTCILFDRRRRDDRLVTDCGAECRPRRASNECVARMLGYAPALQSQTPSCF